MKKVLLIVMLVLLVGCTAPGILEVKCIKNCRRGSGYTEITQARHAECITVSNATVPCSYECSNEKFQVCLMQDVMFDNSDVCYC
jgi:hypothetical protein